jgi:hypothetical protein
MKFNVTDFNPYKKNTLKGFFTVCISDPEEKLAIEIEAFMLHQKGNQRWIEFPGKLDKKGKYDQIIIVRKSITELQIKKLIMEELDKFLAELQQNNFGIF